MIDVAFLDDILTRMLAAGLNELELENGDSRLALRLGAAAATPAGGGAVAPMEVKAQAIGRFRLSHPRRPDLAVAVGDQTTRGTVLGYLELGATLTAIIAPAGGTITDIAPAEGQLVSFGARLFTIEAEA